MQITLDPAPLRLGHIECELTRLAQALEPPLHSMERRESRSHRVERHAFGDAARDALDPRLKQRGGSQ